LALTLSNGGKRAHNLTFDLTKTEVVAKPGDSATAAFAFEQPGNYDFYCSIPGHREAGMRGTVVVGDATITSVAEAHVGHDLQTPPTAADTTQSVLPVPLGTKHLRSRRLPGPSIARSRPG
jgi:nitrite reductase (NO-forming)